MTKSLSKPQTFLSVIQSTGPLALRFCENIRRSPLMTCPVTGSSSSLPNFIFPSRTGHPFPDRSSLPGPVIPSRIGRKSLMLFILSQPVRWRIYRPLFPTSLPFPDRSSLADRLQQSRPVHTSVTGPVMGISSSLPNVISLPGPVISCLTGCNILCNSYLHDQSGDGCIVLTSQLHFTSLRFASLHFISLHFSHRLQQSGASMYFRRLAMDSSTSKDNIWSEQNEPNTVQLVYDRLIRESWRSRQKIFNFLTKVQSSSEQIIAGLADIEFHFKDITPS